MTEDNAVDTNAPEEQQRLFPDAPTDEPVWTVAHTVMGQTISIDVWRSLIKTEMVDQCDIKSNHRKAILRKTEKTLQRGVKVRLGKAQRSANGADEVECLHRSGGPRLGATII